MSNNKFFDRFHSIWSQKRRVQLGQVVVSTLLAAVVGFGVLASADYSLELSSAARAAGLIVAVAAVVGFGGWSLWRAARRWSRPTTAAEIEAAFPELGQSVRTTVQFAEVRTEELKAEGVAESLVVALAERTHVSALPLELTTIVPTGRVRAIGAAFLAVVALLGGSAIFDWEWKTATSRAALNEQPYRSLMVQPGNLLVEENTGAQIDVALIGRTNRDVVLFTRPAGEPEAEWTERTLESRTAEQQKPERQIDAVARLASSKGVDGDHALPNASGHATQSASAPPNCVVMPSAALASRPRAEFSVSLDRMTKPIEYRVRAGELESPVYRIDIRRPLKLVESSVELTPPSYTGQEPSTSLDLNLSVLEGTHAKFTITFDKPVKSASIVLAPKREPRDDDDPNEPVVVPLVARAAEQQKIEQQSGKGPRPESSEGVEGDQALRKSTRLGTKSSDSLTTAALSSTTQTSLFAELALTEDRNYSIIAEAADGTVLPENRFRIRVRQDQPPQVSFESPDDAIEVHTLAELPMKVRVRDDYGLSKGGIVFQINNEQAIPLIDRDFAIVAAAANEVASTGKVSPTTTQLLEKVLPLELFELTQKDSVMYFGFAEDNRPDSPQRTETEMRFIDIRPFKRTWQVLDPDPMPGNNMSSGFKTLEELISRQRFGLNRTMQIEKRAAAGRKPDPTTLDQLMQYETELAQFVRDTALGLESRGFDDTELFYQAEAAILAAVDSLSVGKWENATLQMRDALKLLIEQRDRTRNAILKNPDPARLAALRQFDRMQAQKLRRPKSDKEEARQIIRRLETLIAEENGVAEALEEEKSERQKSEQQKAEPQEPEKPTSAETTSPDSEK